MTEHVPSRITRIREAHPFAHPGWIRALLCYEYKKAMEDPSIAGNDDNLQVRLECVVDVLRRSTEAEVRNHLARVQEYFVNLNPDKYVNEEEAAAYAEYLNDR